MQYKTIANNINISGKKTDSRITEITDVFAFDFFSLGYTFSGSGIGSGKSNVTFFNEQVLF